jgi:hypothetical protein
MLLRRRRLAVLDAIGRLVALQAQVPRDPYVALWSRLDRFRAEALAETIAERRAVRMPLLRATLHLVTAPDALVLRPVLGPAFERALYHGSPFGRRIQGLDVDELIATAAGLLEERPRSRAELAPLLADRWPRHDGPSLAYAVTYLLPLVQVTPRGLWRRSGRSAFTTVEHWLGRPIRTEDAPDRTILRYLAAHGPSTVADTQFWSGLPGLREVFERLRSRLRVFVDERGRELFDVPGGPLPDPETPATVRFLPEYDNAFLAYEDRARIVPGDLQSDLFRVGWGHGLIDGFVAARWRVEVERGRALLRIEGRRPIARAQRVQFLEEGERLLSFLEPDAERRDVRVGR